MATYCEIRREAKRKIMNELKNIEGERKNDN
jgi:hypothetical protein